MLITYSFNWAPRLDMKKLKNIFGFIMSFSYVYFKTSTMFILRKGVEVTRDMSPRRVALLIKRHATERKFNLSTEYFSLRFWTRNISFNACTVTNFGLYSEQNRVAFESDFTAELIDLSKPTGRCPNGDQSKYKHFTIVNWMSNGQRSCPLLQRSELKSRWSLQF